VNELLAWLAERGLVIHLPGTPELIEAAIAFVLTVLALTLGWLAGKYGGGRLSDMWDQFAGTHAGGIKPRLCRITQHGVAALLLAIILKAAPWHQLAALGLGFALGSAAALGIVAILRGLGVARSGAWLVASVAFISILSHALGGLGKVEALLQGIALPMGSHEITALSVVRAAITVIILFALVRLIARLLSHAIGKARGLDPTQKLLAEKLSLIGLVILAFFLGIDLLAIDLTSLAFFSGGLGLAIGFGLQKTIGNLIAGIILLMDRSIKPGDVIVVGESFGWVNKIGVRAVSVVTRDGKEHLIPNENLMTQEVENWSYTDRNVRVRIPVGVAYDCDLKLAQELMLRAASESPRVLDTPRSNVWLTEFGENAVRHEILVWINDPESGVGSVKSDVLNRLWALFKEHGIHVPAPQREVVMRPDLGPRPG